MAVAEYVFSGERQPRRSANPELDLPPTVEVNLCVPAEELIERVTTALTDAPYYDTAYPITGTFTFTEEPTHPKNWPCIYELPGIRPAIQGLQVPFRDELTKYWSFGRFGSVVIPHTDIMLSLLLERYVTVASRILWFEQGSSAPWEFREVDGVIDQRPECVAKNTRQFYKKLLGGRRTMTFTNTDLLRLIS